jgi:hypothetical protein
MPENTGNNLATHIWLIKTNKNKTLNQKKQENKMTSKFKQFTANEYKNIHENCWIEFECPICHELLEIDSENEPVKCSCGNRYAVSAILYHVIEKE